MGTNVNKSLEILKEVSLLDSTRQVILSSVVCLLSRIDDLKKVFYSSEFLDAVDDYLDASSRIESILADNSSCKAINWHSDD